MKTWRERAQTKRRKAAVARAVEYLNAGLAGLSAAAEKRVRDSAQPMSTARALVKEWRGRRRTIAAAPPVDDRAVLIRAAYAMEMGHAWPMGDQAEAA